MEGNKIRRRVLSYYLSVVIFIFIFNRFFQFVELFYVLRYFFLLNILICFFVLSIAKNNIIFQGLIWITIGEVGLYIASFYIQSLSFFPNDSLFSILIASQFAFLLPLISSSIEEYKILGINKRLFKLLVLALCFFILIFTSGRAGLAGFMVAVFLLNFKAFRKLTLPQKSALVVGSLLLLCSLYVAKPDSSRGRLLIYKIVLQEMPVSKWISGIGFGQFKAQYNQYQSRYFAHHSIDSPEALLADNTYFAFNDPFQLTVELGIAGLLILVFFFIVIVRKFIIESKTGFRDNDYLLGAYLAFFSFLTGSLFSYPFQVLSLLPVFIFALSIIFRKEIDRAFYLYYRKTILKFPFRKAIVYPVVAVGFIFIIFKTIWAYKLTAEAQQLSKAGFKHKSVSLYSKISNDLTINPNINYRFAIELAGLKKTDSAILVLRESMQYLYNDRSATLMADLYYEKGMNILAESFYRQAVFINPKLFRNRFALFNFYVETGQKGKAIHWGKSILNLPPKVPSPTTKMIKRQTYEMIQRILNP